jgi:hypothetical protein
MLQYCDTTIISYAFVSSHHVVITPLAPCWIQSQKRDASLIIFTRHPPLAHGSTTGHDQVMANLHCHQMPTGVMAFLARRLMGSGLGSSNVNWYVAGNLTKTVALAWTVALA